MRRDSLIPEGYREERIHMVDENGKVYCRNCFAIKFTKDKRRCTCQRCKNKLNGIFVFNMFNARGWIS